MADKYDYVCKTATVTLPGGTKKRIKVYARTEKEAYKKLAALQTEYEMGLRTFNGNTLFVNWCDEWLENYLRPTVQQSTYNNTANRIKKYILPIIGGLSIREIKTAHIHNCLMQFQGMSLNSAQKTKQVLNRIFEEAYNNQMINRNPVPAAKLPKPCETESRRALTEAERATFMEAVKQYDKGIIFACEYACGLRPQEVRALTWQDIDLKNRTLTVRGAVAAKERRIKAPKSKAGYRTIPMPQWFADMLNKHIRDISTPFVFYGTGDKPMSEQRYKRAWQYFKRRWNIVAGAKTYRNQITQPVIDENIDSYYLRHTYCTMLCENDVHLKTAQYLCGHSSIEITAQIYSHTTPKILDNARQKIEGMI